MNDTPGDDLSSIQTEPVAEDFDTALGELFQVGPSGDMKRVHEKRPDVVAAGTDNALRIDGEVGLSRGRENVGVMEVGVEQHGWLIVLQ